MSDGVHDFDFLIGSWDVANRRLNELFAGCDDWDEFPGHAECRSVFGGTANVRIYRIAPGRRDEFVDFYDNLALPAQQAAGLDVLGQFVSLDDEDTVVWLRRFESVEARERAWDEFYNGPVWVNELAPIADPLIVDTSRSLLVAPTPRSGIQ